MKKIGLVFIILGLWISGCSKKPESVKLDAEELLDANRKAMAEISEFETELTADFKIQFHQLIIPLPLTAKLQVKGLHLQTPVQLAMTINGLGTESALYLKDQKLYGNLPMKKIQIDVKQIPNYFTVLAIIYSAISNEDGFESLNSEKQGEETWIYFTIDEDKLNQAIQKIIYPIHIMRNNMTVPVVKQLKGVLRTGTDHTTKGMDLYAELEINRNEETIGIELTLKTVDIRLQNVSIEFPNDLEEYPMFTE